MSLRGVGGGAHHFFHGHWAHMWINHLVRDAWPVRRQTYRRLLSQPQSVTTLWPVPNYTAWWAVAHVCEPLTQGRRYPAVLWARVDPGTFRSLVWPLTQPRYYCPVPPPFKNFFCCYVFVHYLERPSPKGHIVCRAGRKTLLTRSLFLLQCMTPLLIIIYQAKLHLFSHHSVS